MPAVDVIDDESFDEYRVPGDTRGNDQVRIRTGRAGGVEASGRRPTVSDPPAPEERPSRSGLLKLRRRPHEPS